MAVAGCECVKRSHHISRHSQLVAGRPPVNISRHSDTLPGHSHGNTYHFPFSSEMYFYNSISIYKQRTVHPAEDGV